MTDRYEHTSMDPADLRYDGYGGHLSEQARELIQQQIEAADQLLLDRSAADAQAFIHQGRSEAAEAALRSLLADIRLWADETYDEGIAQRMRDRLRDDL